LSTDEDLFFFSFLRKENISENPYAGENIDSKRFLTSGSCKKTFFLVTRPLRGGGGWGKGLATKKKTIC